MSDIFQEIQEEVRRDKAAEFWQKYRIYIIAVVVLIIAAVAGNQAWKSHQLSLRQQAGTLFSLAEMELLSGNIEAGLEKLDQMSTEASAPAALLAEFRAAAALDSAGQTEAAIQRYDQARIQAGSNATLADLAALKAAMLAMAVEDPSAVQQRLTTLMVDGAPYRLTALELSAVLDLQGGNVSGAREKLNMIIDFASVPPSMIERARILLSQAGE